MEKTIMKFLFVITLNLVCINAIAEEVFWLTHIAAPYDVDYKGNPLPEREPPIEYPDSIRSAGPDTITFKEGKVFFSGEPCNLTIDKMTPFYVDRYLVKVIDAAGGDKKFNRFLKTKLHTDMTQWKKEYSLRESGHVAENNGCKLLQDGIIYRSADELIITDTNFFYRFILRKEKRVTDSKLLSGYVPPLNNGRSCEVLTKKYLSEKVDYCTYADDVDVAQHMNFKYKCFKKNVVNHEANDFYLYDSKKKCVDDYEYFRGIEDYEG